MRFKKGQRVMLKSHKRVLSDRVREQFDTYASSYFDPREHQYGKMCFIGGTPQLATKHGLYWYHVQFPDGSGDNLYEFMLTPLTSDIPRPEIKSIVVYQGKIREE